MYDEMQLVAGKDLATGLFAKSFVDQDSAIIEMDSNPLIMQQKRRLQNVFLQV